ncbi:MAG: TylF/MycF family methyltransferase, partial [Actinomycetota bacterium]|nr:TylF/MycF family methyltransferase [Actinomycetota bacterium]
MTDVSESEHIERSAHAGPEAGPVLTPAELYLSLLKQCLTRYLFIEEEFRPVQARGWRRKLGKPWLDALGKRGVQMGRTGGERNLRRTGRDWPANAETMTGLTRLDKLQECVTNVVARNVPGDLIETGVWRGGSSIFMRGVLAAYGDTSRRVWVADSFRGLPKPNAELYPSDADIDLSETTELAVDLQRVKANFEKYG